MSKIAAGLAKVNGIAASVLSIIPGGAPFAAMAAASAALYGGIAKMTADPPAPPSQIEDVMFGADQPRAFAGGRCELIGHRVHGEAHGREREDVPNPWRTDTIVLNCDGPAVAIDQLYANKNPVNFSSSTGWETGTYSKYLRADTQLGALPETTALSWVANDPGDPPSFSQWTASSKISGATAMQFGMLLDAEETHFRSGAPKFSAVGRWATYYDPRLDGTYDGGVGAHRLGTKSTYAYSVNGIVRGLNYALGIYQNGKLTGGGGLPVTSIDVPSFVAAANIADANSWSCHGVVYENGEDGEIWNNLKLMLQTAAAWPTNDGGILRCLQRRPVVTLDTITEADLEGPYSVKGMTDFKDGFNTLIPTIVSEANEWAEVPIDAVGVPTLVTSQGETRSRSRTYKLVTNPNQAGQLAVLDIYDSVEIDPIQLTVGRRFIAYNVGDAFNTDLPDLGLVDVAVVMLSKKIDLGTGRVIIGVKTDTTAKHAYALGQTNEAPPQTALATNQELQQAADEVVQGPLRGQAIATSHVVIPTGEITAAAQGGSIRVTVPAHTRVYGNPLEFGSVAINAATIDVPADGSGYWIHYDDPDLAGGSITLGATTDGADAVTSGVNPYRHHVAFIPATDGQSGIPATAPTIVPVRVPNADNSAALGDRLATDLLPKIDAALNQAQTDALIAAAKVTLEAADATLDAAVGGLDTRLDGVETGFSAQGTRITNVETEQDGQATRLTAVEAESTNSQSRVATLEATTADQGTRLNLVETESDDSQSRVATLETTTSDQGTRLTTVETESTDSQSRVGTLETTTTSQAQSITALGVRTSTAEGSITALNTVTGQSAASVQQLQARGRSKPNIITNSDFAVEPTDGAVADFNPNGFTRTHGVLGDFDYSPRGLNAFYILHEGAAGGYTDARLIKSIGPVSAGDVIIPSILTGAHRCAVEALVFYHDSSSGEFGATLLDANGSNNEEKAGGTFTDCKRLYKQVTVPSGAVEAFIVGRKLGHTSAHTNSFAFFSGAMIEHADADQTEPSPYAPGSGRAVAEDNKAEIVVNRSIVDGVVSDTTTLFSQTADLTQSVTDARSIADGNVTALSALGVRTSTAEGSITALNTVTGQSAASVQQLQARGRSKPNIITNSDFAVEPSGGSVADSNPNGFTRSQGVLDSFDYSPQGLNAFYILHDGAEGGFTDARLVKSIGPVSPGDEIIPSIYTGAHRCLANAIVMYRDNAGAEIAGEFLDANGGNNSDKPGGTFSDCKRLYRKVTVPANAVEAFILARKEGHSSDHTNSFAFYSGAMIEHADLDQTEPSPYAPGSGRAANDALESEAEVLRADIALNEAGLLTASATLTETALVTQDLAGDAEAFRMVQLDANGFINSIVQRVKVTGAKVVNDIIMRADRIVLISGQAVFALLSDRVKVNVPIDVERAGDVVSLGSPNAALWAGDPAIALANRTPANSALSVSNGRALINGQLYTAGGSLYQSLPDTGSEADVLTTTTEAFQTSGNAMVAQVLFTGKGQSSAVAFGSPGSSGVFAYGSMRLRIQYKVGDGAWVDAVAASTRTTQISTSWSEGDDANEFVSINAVDWSEDADASSTQTPGATVTWRAIADQFASLTPSVLLKTKLSISVSDP